jgi:hypothetical protein
VTDLERKCAEALAEAQRRCEADPTPELLAALNACKNALIAACMAETQHQGAA